ncbi:MAG: OmpA family protein [Oscillospiraceae bacterium]|jgi:chemotaxis protein MotB|nr:OmpA family protein [Oscillospiraceae bacterium]
MARSKKKQPEKQEEHWMATFSDMVTLLLCFFVLLFMMSTLDVDKYKALMMNLRGSPDIFETIDSRYKIGDTGLQTAPEVPAEWMTDPSDWWAMIGQEILDKVSEFNENQGQAGSERPGADPLITITVEITDAQIIIRCQGEILFATLSDVLQPEGYGIIDYIMSDLVMPRVINREISELNILGHADIRQIPAGRSKFTDNWELSTARALEAWKYVRNNYDIPPSMGGAMGYGSERPIHGNFGTTEDEWRQNRRVEFVMVRNFYMDEQAGTTYEKPA